jgi:hypothetical protein
VQGPQKGGRPSATGSAATKQHRADARAIRKIWAEKAGDLVRRNNSAMSSIGMRDGLFRPSRTPLSHTDTALLSVVFVVFVGLLSSHA